VCIPSTTVSVSTYTYTKDHLVNACSQPHPRPHVNLVLGSLLLLVIIIVVVIITGSLLQISLSEVWRASRGAWCGARLSEWVHHDVGEVRATKARGRKRQRWREGKVGGDRVREASFTTNPSTSGLCEPYN
jgi:hypothetical protein